MYHTYISDPANGVISEESFGARKFKSDLDKLYMSTMRTPPTQFLEPLNSIQKDFIWNNSRAKIKHCSIIADYKEGEYKDVDISSKLLAMKISWIKRFLGDNFHPWRILPTWSLAYLGGSSIFHYNLQLRDRCSTIVKTCPAFCQELIEL